MGMGTLWGIIEKRMGRSFERGSHRGSITIIAESFGEDRLNTNIFERHT